MAKAKFERKTREENQKNFDNLVKQTAKCGELKSSTIAVLRKTKYANFIPPTAKPKYHKQG